MECFIYKRNFLLDETKTFGNNIQKYFLLMPNNI